MLRVAAHTSGWHDPSARFRVRQYLRPLAALGIGITEFPSLFGSYPPPERLLRPLWGIAALTERCLQAIRSRRFDLTLQQREMIATLYTAEALTTRPRVLDVDDAIWLHGHRSAARKLANNADLVICGNAYIADRFSNWTRRIAILPTGVDTERFVPSLESRTRDAAPVIGWSGTSSGFRFLARIAPAIATVLRRVPGATFRIVADKPPSIPELGQISEFVRWSPETEVAELQKFTVGIMPLDYSSWARGKCAFKLLTYMSCGLPVVASPVGMNAEVLAACGGAGPSSESEWVDSLTLALQDTSWATRTGNAGRVAVVKEFSVGVLAPRFAGLLREVC